MTPVNIVRLQPTTQTHPTQLYSDYAQGYKWNEQKATVLWTWITGTPAIIIGLAAKLQSGEIVGFIHVKETVRAIHACNHGYIEDLYVVPKYRGKGVADALMQGVIDLAKERGWPTIRWITTKDNGRARAFYDRLATKTDRITYEIKI